MWHHYGYWFEKLRSNGLQFISHAIVNISQWQVGLDEDELKAKADKAIKVFADETWWVMNQLLSEHYSTPIMELIHRQRTWNLAAFEP